MLITPAGFAVIMNPSSMAQCYGKQAYPLGRRIRQQNKSLLQWQVHTSHCSGRWDEIRDPPPLWSLDPEQIITPTNCSYYTMYAKRYGVLMTSGIIFVKG